MPLPDGQASDDQSMRIAIVSDAWQPQVNGVVRTLERLLIELATLGHVAEVIGPDHFRSIPCPTYPDIRLSFALGPRLAKLIEAIKPSAIHIATEGPLGWAARSYCLHRRLPFTTAYHTRFPEYVRARTALPVAASYRLLRQFHVRSSCVMVATASLERELSARGFLRLRRWSRGVDTELFRPRGKTALDLPRPIHLYVGRLAVEKNLRSFLDLELPGSIVLVGDGPQEKELKRRYPKVHFLGRRTGEDLAGIYDAADVFVFPSRTDTFGLVLLEALAAGVPVAAFPVPGPQDVIGDSGAGVLSDDLGAAIKAALNVPAAKAREHALRFSWKRSAEQFIENLRPLCQPKDNLWCHGENVNSPAGDRLILE
jgi:1,2-diacylglycerol 3-alpha-glucosyltransferase/glucuronosyltransferase